MKKIFLLTVTVTLLVAGNATAENISKIESDIARRDTMLSSLFESDEQPLVLKSELQGNEDFKMPEMELSQIDVSKEIEKFRNEKPEKSFMKRVTYIPRSQTKSQLSSQQQPYMSSEAVKSVQKDCFKVTVLFAAGYDRNAMLGIVTGVRQNGIQGVYLLEAADKNGNVFWRVQVDAKSVAEAQALSEKLTAMGLRNIIVK